MKHLTSKPLGTSNNIMVKSILFILFMAVASDAFFIRTRDLRRIFRFLPKTNEILHGGAEEQEHYHPPPQYYQHQSRPEGSHHKKNHFQPDYYQDDNEEYYRDRTDDPRNHDGKNSYPRRDRNGGNSHHNRPLYEKGTQKPHRHAPDCEHNQENSFYKFEDRKHHHQKYGNSEETGDFYDDNDQQRDDYRRENNEYKKYYHSAKDSNPRREKKFPPGYFEKYQDDADDDYNKFSYKKDYVTGVLVTIPKIKEDENLANYFPGAQTRNPFFQHFLKTDNDDQLTQGSPPDYPTFDGFFT